MMHRVQVRAFAQSLRVRDGLHIKEGFGRLLIHGEVHTTIKLSILKIFKCNQLA
jgi:hypothetical protein